MSPSAPRLAPDRRASAGRAAEDAAAAWLRAAGWELVARNWRRGPGELDIVARKGEVLAFVEVKRVDALGAESLERSVGYDKRRRIVETAKLFVAMHREFEQLALRFDVAAVKAGEVGLYIENAFPERA